MTPAVYERDADVGDIVRWATLLGRTDKDQIERLRDFAKDRAENAHPTRRPVFAALTLTLEALL